MLPIPAAVAARLNCHMERSGLFLLVILLMVATGIGGLYLHVQNEKTRLKNPTVSVRTETDRRASLSALERAWNQRPLERTLRHARDEKDFINHTAFFVQQIYRRETGPSAIAFYRRTVSDFMNRYGSEDYLDGAGGS